MMRQVIDDIAYCFGRIILIVKIGLLYLFYHYLYIPSVRPYPTSKLLIEPKSPGKRIGCVAKGEEVGLWV